MVLTHGQSFFRNSSLTFSVPFLRTPNSYNAELENSMSPGLFLSLLSGRQAGQGRMGTLEEFLFPFAFFRCYFPKRLHWLASTSASVTKSWRSDTVTGKDIKLSHRGIVWGLATSPGKSHTLRHELQVVTQFFNSKLGSLTSSKSMCRHFLSFFLNFLD